VADLSPHEWMWMPAHLSSIDWLPGTTVGIYPLSGARPKPRDVPLAQAVVPTYQQVVFIVPVAGVRYWMAGDDGRGWRVAQVTARAGRPSDVRGVLTRDAARDFGFA
jgi:hypothetical protein